MIEDRTENPTRWPLESDNADNLIDDERDRRAERFALLNPAPKPTQTSWLARAMLRHAERQAQMHAEQEARVSDSAVHGADSMFGALA